MCFQFILFRLCTGGNCDGDFGSGNTLVKVVGKLISSFDGTETNEIGSLRGHAHTPVTKRQRRAPTFLGSLV
jgi:hypothetical protein